MRLNRFLAAAGLGSRRHCDELIAGYKRPRSYTFRQEPLPLSAAGKILKSELRKPFWEGRDRQIS